jgi:hypothetical protein
LDGCGLRWDERNDSCTTNRKATPWCATKMELSDIALPMGLHRVQRGRTPFSRKATFHSESQRAQELVERQQLPVRRANRFLQQTPGGYFPNRPYVQKRCDLRGTEHLRFQAVNCAVRPSKCLGVYLRATPPVLTPFIRHWIRRDKIATIIVNLS